MIVFLSSYNKSKDLNSRLQSSTHVVNEKIQKMAIRLS